MIEQILQIVSVDGQEVTLMDCWLKVVAQGSLAVMNAPTYSVEGISFDITNVRYVKIEENETTVKLSVSL